MIFDLCVQTNPDPGFIEFRVYNPDFKTSDSNDIQRFNSFFIYRFALYMLVSIAGRNK